MTPLEAALFWIDRGFHPIPIPHQRKGPTLPDWQNLRITRDNAHQYFNGSPQNIGILLGDTLGSTDVDCDCPEAVTAAALALPPTGLIFGRKSKPASHYFYRTDPTAKNYKLRDPLDGQTIIELRGLTKTGEVGLQTVVPPSTHESGEPIQFVKDGSPQNVDADILDYTVRFTGAAALLARHYPAAGKGRHSTELALANILRARGLTEEVATAFLTTTYRSVPSHDRSAIHRVSESVRYVYNEGASSPEKLGFPWLNQTFGAPVLNRALEWLGLQRAEPQELDPEAPKPKLTLDTLPDIFDFAGITIPYLVDGLLVEGGITIFSGPPGHGKTTIASCIGAHVARGIPFAGRNVIQRDVAMLDRENPVHFVIERMHRLGLRNHGMRIWGGWLWEDPPDPGSPMVIDWVRSHNKPLVIIDSLVRFLRGDENSSTEVSAYMTKLRQLTFLGATVLLIHHTGKGESSSNYRGSSDIPGAIDTGYKIVNLSPDLSILKTVQMTAWKVRARVDTTINLGWSDSSCQWAQEYQREQTPDDILTGILATLVTASRAELVERAAEHGLGYKSVRDWTDQAILSGKVVKSGGSKNTRYTLSRTPPKTIDEPLPWDE